MRSRSGSIILFCLLACLATPAFAQWWTGQEEGWFFYNEQIERPIERKEQIEPPPAEPPELFVDRMARVGKELISRAVEEPTEDNLKSYMEHNKAMLALSDNFSRVWRKVAMKYPYLLADEGLTYAHRDVKRAIDSLKQEAGLYFIHSASCDACKRQAAELKKFEERHGMAVFPITVDSPLPEYPDAKVDNGIASRLDVTDVPSIFIAFPATGTIELVSRGYVDAFDLERRIYDYARPLDKEVYDLLRSAHQSSSPDG